MKTLLAVAAAVVVLAAGSGAARPVTGHDRKLIAAHQCQPDSVEMVPPVAGYLIGLHSKPHKPLFYKSADELTAGLFWGWGGDWVTRYWCSR